MSGRRDAGRAAAIAGLLTAAVSLLGASPGLGPLDAGDFVTAAADLGVPHATGFPAYVLGGHAFTLLPFGNIAGRLAWWSAVLSGAGAAAFTWFAARVACAGRGAYAVAAAVTAAFIACETLMMHARVPEVYALCVALIGGALCALEHVRCTADIRGIWVLGICCGLGAATHATFGLWAPLLWLAGLAVSTPTMRRRAAFGAPLFGVFAAAAVLYLPAAARRSPAHNWGDPSTLARLWEHLTAAQIREGFAAEMQPSTFSLSVHLSTFSEQLWHGLGGLLLLGALAAIVFGARHRGWALCIVGLALADIWYAVAINPMGLRDWQNGQLTALLLAAGAGALLGAWAEEFAARIGRAGAAALGPILALCCVAPAIGGPLGGTGSDWSVEDLALSHAALAQPESVTITVSDTLSAASLYAWVALDLRPDSAIALRTFLSDGHEAVRHTDLAPFSVVPDELRALWVSEGVGEGDNTRALVVALTAMRSDHPVYWEAHGRGDDLVDALALTRDWPLGQVLRATDDDVACSSGRRGWCGGRVDVDFAQAARTETGGTRLFYRRWLARQHGYLGARAFDARDFVISGAHFEAARRVDPTNPAWVTGVALALANVGRFAEALAVELEALAMNPLSVTAARNALRMAQAARDPAQVTALREHLDKLGAADQAP